MNTTTLEQDKCPACKKDLNTAAPVDGEAVPKPGDFQICIHCGTWSEYNDDMKLVAFTQEDLDAVHPTLRKEMDEVWARIQAIKKQIG